MKTLLAILLIGAVSTLPGQIITEQQSKGGYIGFGPVSGQRIHPASSDYYDFSTVLLDTVQLRQPLRRVEQKIIDLRPLCRWIRLRDPKVERPNEEWRAFMRVEVAHVAEGGLEIYLDEKQPRTIYVVNYPEKVVDGQRIHFIATKTGTYSVGGSTLEKFDCGVAISEEEAAAIYQKERDAATRQQEERLATIAKAKANGAAKALAWHRGLAEKGDAFGQFEMGEHYRRGDGVERNETTAREWYAKAAAQGHAKAKEMLEKMEGEQSKQVTSKP